MQQSWQTLAELSDPLVINGCAILPKSSDAIKPDLIGKFVRKQLAAGRLAGQKLLPRWLDANSQRTDNPCAGDEHFAIMSGLKKAEH
jgi:hypothetical protein